MSADNDAEKREKGNEDKAGLRRELENTPGVVSEKLDTTGWQVINPESLEAIAVFEEMLPDSDFAFASGVSYELYAVIGAGEEGDMIGVVHRVGAKRKGYEWLLTRYNGMNDFSNTDESVLIPETDLRNATLIGQGEEDTEFLEKFDELHHTEQSQYLKLLDNEHTSPRQAMVLSNYHDELCVKSGWDVTGGIHKPTNDTFVYFKPKQ
jgi:hypothetical protein